MADLIRWDPFRELSEIRDSFDRLFDRSFLRQFKEGDIFRTASFLPRISVSEEDDNIIVEAELPGIEKKDVSISVKDNVLTIKGETKKEKKEEKKGKYYYSERYYGNFYRTVELPKQVDDKKAKASYKDGVLKIELPIAKEEKEKVTKIEIE